MRTDILNTPLEIMNLDQQKCPKIFSHGLLPLCSRCCFEVFKFNKLASYSTLGVTLLAIIFVSPQSSLCCVGFTLVEFEANNEE